MIKCPNCKRDITSMKNLHKKHKWNWTCKCGTNVTRLKLEELIERIKEVTGVTDEKELVKHLPLF